MPPPLLLLCALLLLGGAAAQGAAGLSSYCAFPGFTPGVTHSTGAACTALTSCTVSGAAPHCTRQGGAE